MKPLELPEPCPICGKKVFVMCVEEWETISSKPLSVQMECETEPDIESDEWPEWHAEHYHMPYVDWLPYEIRAVKWLQDHFSYDGNELIAKSPLPVEQQSTPPARSSRSRQRRTLGEDAEQP